MITGLQFPVKKVLKHIRQGRYAPKVSVTGGIYLTASVEWMVAEHRFE